MKQFKQSWTKQLHRGLAAGLKMRHVRKHPESFRLPVCCDAGSVQVRGPHSAPHPQTGGPSASLGAACQLPAPVGILPAFTPHVCMPVCLAQRRPAPEKKPDGSAGKALKNDVCNALLSRVTATPRPPPLEPWCPSGQRGRDGAAEGPAAFHQGERDKAL